MNHGLSRSIPMRRTVLLTKGAMFDSVLKLLAIKIACKDTRQRSSL
jgi:hypothetical protein